MKDQRNRPLRMRLYDEDEDDSTDGRRDNNQRDGEGPSDEEESLQHVERMAKGGLMCKSCGGMVDGDGYASGGLVEDAEGDPIDEYGDDDLLRHEVGDDSMQRAQTVRMRRFALALKGEK